MRIAVIGTGISGALAARLLSTEHEVDVFESNDYVGGHTNTVDVGAFDQRYSVDTGFMVFNRRTYPNFCRMLSYLNIPAQESDMSFSVRCEQTGLEYQGSSLNGLFAQRVNLLRPRFYRMLRDILRFNRLATEAAQADSVDDRTTVGEFLTRCRVGGEFIRSYFVPMTAAIWSSQPERILSFPARFMIGFCHNHGLLQVRDRPQWMTIPGGARRYMDALTAPVRERIRLNSAVESVVRGRDHATVRSRGGNAETFDHVVFATHADQTLEVLDDATDKERDILRSFAYHRNEAVLHTDTGLLPVRRRAWASWNYTIAEQPHATASVTYDLSRLQNHESPSPILLTLNRSARIDSRQILRTMAYDHPAYSVKSVNGQRRHAEINGVQRTHFCGAYWGFGFHEDGVNSALAVASHFGLSLEACTVASTRDEFRIAATVR